MDPSWISASVVCAGVVFTIVRDIRKSGARELQLDTNTDDIRELKLTVNSHGIDLAAIKTELRLTGGN
jgi:hypothetical protein